MYSRKGLNFYFGFNALTGGETEIAVPYPGAPPYVPNFTLNPTGSRYASIEIARFLTLSEGKKNAFRLGYGLEIDWYNFMFDHNRIATKGPNGVQFATAYSAPGKEIALSKNKMSVSYLTLPIMPHFAFDKKSAVQMIAIGGYVSYRIDTWTKAIEEESGNKFGINEDGFRYRPEDVPNTPVRILDPVNSETKSDIKDYFEY